MAAVIHITNLVCSLGVILLGLASHSQSDTTQIEQMLALITDSECNQLSKVYLIYQSIGMLLPNMIQQLIDIQSLILPWAPIVRGLLVLSYMVTMATTPLSFLIFYSDLFASINYCNTMRDDWQLKLGAAVQSSFINIMAVASLSHFIEVLRIACCSPPSLDDPVRSHNLKELEDFYRSRLGIDTSLKIFKASFGPVLRNKSLSTLRVRDLPLSIHVYLARSKVAAVKREVDPAQVKKSYLAVNSFNDAKDLVREEIKGYFRVAARAKYSLRNDHSLVRSRQFQVLLIEGIGQLWQHKESTAISGEFCCWCKAKDPTICIPSCKHKYHYGCIAASIMCPVSNQYCAIEECGDLREEYLWILCDSSK